MISSKRPFQIAGWALMMALGLSLTAAITDPHAVRRAILAKADHQVRSSKADVLLAGDLTESVIDPLRVTSTHAPEAGPITVAGTTTPPPSIANALPAVPRPYDHASVGFQQKPMGESEINSQTVSSVIAQPDLMIDPPRRPSGGSMLVVSPQQLRGGSARSLDVEFLPPPPEMEIVTEALEQLADRQTTTQASMAERSVDADVRQRWLEAEILSLRREVHHLAESQQLAERIDVVLSQQQQLLKRYHSLPADRLIEVIGLLHQQSSTVSRPSLRTERVNQFITDAELDELLGLLERITDKHLAKDASSSLSASPTTVPTATSPDRANPPVHAAATLGGVQPLDSVR